MNADLSRLIHLQQLDTAAEEARRKIATHPQRVQQLEDRLAAAKDSVATVKAGLTDAQNKRRAEEKEVAAVQTRLAKYKDQLLEVKTNREYSAMLHEIEAAQNDIKAREDVILEAMMQGDDLSAAVKKAEVEFKTIEKEVAAERQVLDQEVASLQANMDKTAAERDTLIKEISPDALSTFERVARVRKGQAVAQASNGMCTICHVRLRPQVFNDIRSNEAIIQCDSCQRILFFVGENAAPVPQP